MYSSYSQNLTHPKNNLSKPILIFKYHFIIIIIYPEKILLLLNYPSSYPSLSLTSNPSCTCPTKLKTFSISSFRNLKPQSLSIILLNLVLPFFQIISQVISFELKIYVHLIIFKDPNPFSQFDPSHPKYKYMVTITIIIILLIYPHSQFMNLEEDIEDFDVEVDDGPASSTKKRKRSPSPDTVNKWTSHTTIHSDIKKEKQKRRLAKRMKKNATEDQFVQSNSLIEEGSIQVLVTEEHQINKFRLAKQFTRKLDFIVSERDITPNPNNPCSATVKLPKRFSNLFQTDQIIQPFKTVLIFIKNEDNPFSNPSMAAEQISAHIANLLRVSPPIPVEKAGQFFLEAKIENAVRIIHKQEIIFQSFDSSPPLEDIAFSLKDAFQNKDKPDRAFRIDQQTIEISRHTSSD